MQKAKEQADKSGQAHAGYRLLYTQMLRNRNRVADAVLTACEYAELFLAQK